MAEKRDMGLSMSHHQSGHAREFRRRASADAVMDIDGAAAVRKLAKEHEGKQSARTGSARTGRSSPGSHVGTARSNRSGNPDERDFHDLHKKQVPRKRPTKKTEEQEDAESGVRAKGVMDKASKMDEIQFRELFNFFDASKDKTWGAEEFSAQMNSIGCPVSPEEATELLHNIGVRDVDRITFNDFVQLMPKLKAFRKVLEKDALRLFRQKDWRGRGYITLSGMREIMETLSGDDMNPEQVDHIIGIADREHTGCITYDWFIRAVFKTAPLLEYVPPERRHGLVHHCFGCGQQAQESSSSSSDSEDGLPHLPNAALDIG